MVRGARAAAVRGARPRALHVICTAPVPRPALRALARLTGWTAEPFLVDDAVWERALDSYAPAVDERHQSEVVHDLAAASAHVVAAAATGRDAVIRYAGCGGFRLGARRGRRADSRRSDSRRSHARRRLQRTERDEGAARGSRPPRLGPRQRRHLGLQDRARRHGGRRTAVVPHRARFGRGRHHRRHAARLPPGHDQHRPAAISTRRSKGRLLRRHHARAASATRATGRSCGAPTACSTTAMASPILPAGAPTNPGQIRVGTGQISISEDGTREGRRRDRRTDQGGRSSHRKTTSMRESGTRFRAKAGVTPAAATPRIVGGVARAVERDDGGPDGGAHRGCSAASKRCRRGVSTLMNDIDARAISELGRDRRSVSVGR